MSRRERSSGPIEVVIRPVNPSDAPGIGLMVFAGLFDAPSSPFLPQELGEDLVVMGQDVIDGAVFGDEMAFVGIDGGAPVALARLMPRPFVRGAHIGTLQILVSPAWRKRTIGRQMLDTLCEHPHVVARFERLEIAIAAHDRASRGLLRDANIRATTPAWGLERCEVGGLRVEQGFVDLELWVRDLRVNG